LLATEAQLNELRADDENPEVRVVHVQLLDAFSELYFLFGDVAHALLAAEKQYEFAIGPGLPKSASDEMIHAAARSYLRLGDVRVEMGDVSAVTNPSSPLTTKVHAAIAFQKALELMEQLARSNRRTDAWERDLSRAYERVGDVSR